jgi:hypothetical protein
MATIDSKEIIQKMVDNNGIYPGDPQVLAIYEYRSSLSGNAAWAVCYVESDRESALSSPFVLNPRPIWTREDGKISDPGVEPKSEGMENLLENVAQMAFGRSREASRKGSTCVTCGGEATEFKDALSRKEYGISGMCQKCQDSFFGGGE